MRIRVVYLGGSRGESGVATEELDLPSGATILDVQQRVAQRHPRLAARLATVRWARNHQLATLGESVADGDEIALLPPVAGGTPTAADRVAVQSEPIDIAAVVRRVQRPEAGAVVTFIGTVRDHARGERVLSLTYEAYEPMASRALAEIVERLEAEIEGVLLAITHRTGQLAVGAESVIIAAASAHRDEAYRACRAALEALKSEVPIWKRELTEDGETWVGWGAG